MAAGVEPAQGLLPVGAAEHASYLESVEVTAVVAGVFGPDAGERWYNSLLDAATLPQAHMELKCCWGMVLECCWNVAVAPSRRGLACTPCLASAVAVGRVLALCFASAGTAAAASADHRAEDRWTTVEAAAKHKDSPRDQAGVDHTAEHTVAPDLQEDMPGRMA